MVRAIQSLLSKVDVTLLAGRRSVLAIDERERFIRVLELRNTTNPFRRHLPRFRVLHSIDREYPDGSLPIGDDRVKFLEALLREVGITTRSIALPLPGHAARSVLVEVPGDSGDSIEEWLEEHYTTIFEFGPAREEITLHHEVLSRDEFTINLELTCVRNRAVRELEELYTRHNFEVVWIGSPERALKSAIDLLTTLPREYRTLQLGLVDGGILSTTLYKDGIKNIIHTTDFKGLENFRLGLKSPPDAAPGPDQDKDQELRMLAFRDGVETIGLPEGIGLFRPLDVAPQYAHLVGLAAGSYYPEIAGVNFQSQQSTEVHETNVAKNLFERTALAFGVCLFVLLGGLAITRVLLEDQRETIDQEIARSGVSIQALHRLEGEVKDLRSRVTGNRDRRDILSRTLYDLAHLTPDSVYFSTLSVENTQGGRYEISLAGYAERATNLASFLASLESSNQFGGVKLIRSASAASPSKCVIPVSLRKPPCVVFELIVYQAEKKGGG